MESHAPSSPPDTTLEPANTHEPPVRRAATPPAEEERYHKPDSLIGWMIDCYWQLRAIVVLCLFFWWIGRWVDAVANGRQV